MNKFYLIAFAAAGLLAASCQDFDPWDGDVKQYEYRKEFQKAFGNIDPNHTWNTAAQRSMDFKINIPGTFYLRVFTTEPRVESAESELLAYYKNDGRGYEGCTGETYSINFDGPSGLKKVYADIEYVSDGRHILLPVMLDEEGHGVVEYGKMDTTRGTIHPVAQDNQNTTSRGHYIYSDSEDIKHFNKDAYDASAGGFMDLIPENVENTNKEYVSVDFSYVSTGQPLHLYPMYTYTGATVTIGLQYRNPNDPNDPNYNWPQSINFDEEKIWTTTPTRDTENNTGGRIQREFNDNRTDWGGSPHNWTDYTSANFKHTICPGITIDLPVGYEFRFWVYQEHSGTQVIRYSQTKDNSDKLHYFGTFNNGHKHTEPNETNAQDVLYLGVEDWTNTVHDINDIVLAFVGELPLVMEESGVRYDEAEYIIAYEDMGAIGDFDFNDVVFSVRHVSGASIAEVDLRAVGGTLPVYLTYEDGKNAKKDLFGGQELHAALSAEQPTRTTDLKPINVSGNGKIVDRTNMYFAEDETITITTGSSIVTAASNFKLKVVREDGTYDVIHAPNPNKDDANAIYPQAIIVAKHNWNWATENTRISDAYPKFSEWVTNRNNSTDWFDPKWSGEDEHSTVIDYGVTLLPSYAYEKCLLNRDVISLKEEEAKTNSNIGEYELVIPKSDLVITHYNENGQAEVNHDLTTYPSFNLAFVVTGRESNQSVTIKVYKNSSTNDPIETIVFDDDHNNSSTTSSFGESHSEEVSIDWQGVDQIVVKVEQHPGNCHLNSIWTAMPENNFHVMKQSSVATTVTVESPTATVALAYVGTNHHVMDYTNRNGYCSFGNYATMLSQIENNGIKQNASILFTLERKSDGHYMLKNHNGDYLQAPTEGATPTWASVTTNAADLEIEACPSGTPMMQGCSNENAVCIKSGNYYLSATGKPATWRTNSTNIQRAIYLFHWEGNH